MTIEENIAAAKVKLRERNLAEDRPIEKEDSLRFYTLMNNLPSLLDTHFLDASIWEKTVSEVAEALELYSRSDGTPRGFSSYPGTHARRIHTVANWLKDKTAENPRLMDKTMLEFQALIDELEIRASRSIETVAGQKPILASVWVQGLQEVPYDWAKSASRQMIVATAHDTKYRNVPVPLLLNVKLVKGGYAVSDMMKRILKLPTKGFYSKRSLPVMEHLPEPMLRAMAPVLAEPRHRFALGQALNLVANTPES